MFAQKNKLCCLVIVYWGLLSTNYAAEPPTPLQQTLASLQCATDSRLARKTLDKLWHISPVGQDWPDEWFGKKPEQAGLYAATLDIALVTLQHIAQRFPDLRETAERVALQWNYCDILDEQRFYNLRINHGLLERTLATNDAPLKWQGFRQWGFLSPDPVPRFVPRLLDEITLAPTAYQLFFHRIYRQHCFPHPETGLLFNEENAEKGLSRTYPLIQLNEVAQNYPFTWQLDCPTVKQIVPKSTQVQTTVQVSQSNAKTEKTAVTKTSASSNKKTVVAVSDSSQLTVLTVANNALPVAKKLNQTESKARAIKKTKSLPVTPFQAKLANAPSIVPSSAMGAIPVYFETTDTALQAHGTTGILESKKLRLAGSLAGTYNLADGSQSLSANVTWSPKPKWFMSSAMSVKNKGDLSYSWSAGYADYNAGGWSAQINNWGPIKPSDGLALDKAVVNVGYKFKAKKLEKHKLSTSANLSMPLKGKPSMSGTIQWTPKTHWYVRSTTTVPLAGGKPNWTYAFGYADPRPGKWRVEYSNYNSNRFPGDNLNKGSITISRGWQF